MASILDRTPRGHDSGMFRGAGFHTTYRAIVVAVSEIPPASHAHWPLATTNDHLQPLPRGESCNATTAHLHKHDSNQISSSRRPAKCRQYDSGADGRDEKDHAPCSSCQPADEMHVGEGNKRNIWRPRSLSARTPQHAGPGIAAHEHTHTHFLSLSLSLSCREAAEPLSFLPLELNPAQPMPQGREAPSKSLSLRRKPRESVHRRQLNPSSTQTKAIVRNQVREYEVERMERSTGSKHPCGSLRAHKPMT